MPAERAYVPGMSSSTLMTADELLQVRIPDKHVELVRGVLVVREPPGYTHGRVTVNLAVRLAAQIDTAGSGQVLVVETGFKVARNPDTVRGPDLAVLCRDQARVGHRPRASPLPRLPPGRERDTPDGRRRPRRGGRGPRVLLPAERCPVGSGMEATRDERSRDACGGHPRAG